MYFLLPSMYSHLNRFRENVVSGSINNLLCSEPGEV